MGSMKHGSILLLACAMLAGSSATFSTARAQGFDFFLPPPMYAPPPPPPFYGPDSYDEAEPYYQRAPRRYRPAPQRKHYAPAPRRKKSARAVERKAPLRKDRQVALTVPAKAPTKQVATSSGCEKTQSSVAEFGFTEIKPQGCTGKTATFRAKRDGKSFDIEVLASSGELTKVQRLK
jgi:hypothetical protein